MSFVGHERGTPDTVWESSARLNDLPRLALPAVDRVLVVAAHADDETLGAAGLIVHHRDRGIPVDVLVVTDGAASHPGVDGTAEVRVQEIERALAELGVGIGLRHLGVPDSGTPEHRDRILAAVLEAAAGTAGRVLLVSTWAGDGHRDHRVVGEVVAEAARALGHPALAFPIWLWHWAHPEHADVPWERMRVLPLGVDAALRKHRALGRYESQIAPRPGTPGEPAVLHPLFLRTFDRDEAFVVVEEPAAAEPGGTGAAYFDGLYRRHEDPWGYTSRWYERRKRALTLAALPAERYASVLEIGCSIGVLAEELAGRADRLVAVDVSEAAVDRARRRLSGQPHVRVDQRDVTDELPDGDFDLIVLSEVGYYLAPEELDRLLTRIRDRLLATDGTLVSAHWRHPIDGLALDGDAVRAAVDRLGLARLVRHTEEDLALDVHAADGRSVARRAGLV